MAITEKSIKTIQDEINAAMAVIAKKHNLKIAKNGIRYSAESFKLNMEFCDVGSVEEGVDPVLAKDMGRYGYKYGFNVADIGKTFMSHGEEFKIEGMRGYTFIIASNTKGKYKFKGEVVQRIMGR